jgi:hypothetical protein
LTLMTGSLAAPHLAHLLVESLHGRAVRGSSIAEDPGLGKCCRSEG